VSAVFQKTADIMNTSRTHTYFMTMTMICLLFDNYTILYEDACVYASFEVVLRQVDSM
jgi:hypothetical protein